MNPLYPALLLAQKAQDEAAKRGIKWNDLAIGAMRGLNDMTPGGQYMDAVQKDSYKPGPGYGLAMAAGMLLQPGAKGREQTLRRLLKKPWQMTLKEFTSQASQESKKGTVRVYHAISNEKDLDGVLKEGLLLRKKAPHGEGPRNLLWGATDPDGFSKDKTLLALDVPKGMVDGKDGWVTIRGDVTPDMIVGVDLAAHSSVSLGGRVSREASSEYASEYYRAYVDDAISRGEAVPEHIIKELSKIR